MPTKTLHPSAPAPAPLWKCKSLSTHWSKGRCMQVCVCVWNQVISSSWIRIWMSLCRLPVWCRTNKFNSCECFLNKWMNKWEKDTVSNLACGWTCIAVSALSMSGMMSNAVGGPAAGVGGLSDISSLIEAWVLSNLNPKGWFDLSDWWMILGGREK